MKSVVFDCQKLLKSVENHAIQEAWAKLDKIFTPDFYNYMKNPANFNSAPALTGNAYEDMRYALESNNVCTGWQPQHRIQFAHSKGDTVVPYGNYLAFRDAHPDSENDIYRIDDG